MINKFSGNLNGYLEFDGYIFYQVEDGIYTLDISCYTAIITTNEPYTVGIFRDSERIEPLYVIDTKEQAFAFAIDNLSKKVISNE